MFAVFDHPDDERMRELRMLTTRMLRAVRDGHFALANDLRHRRHQTLESLVHESQALSTAA